MTSSSGSAASSCSLMRATRLDPPLEIRFRASVLRRLRRMGCFLQTCLRSERVNSKTSHMPVDSTSAVRSESIVSAISPKYSPFWSLPTGFSSTETLTVPLLTKYMPMPMVPARMMHCLERKRRGRRRDATSATISVESSPARKSVIFLTRSNSFGIRLARWTPSLVVLLATLRMALKTLPATEPCSCFPLLAHESCASPTRSRRSWHAR
mmetsp:Transcript_16335/g.41356  ORF Transcript_16335/g.41356 Transcript_16335/m.41356 type:complete len:210 (-) Transcript_16335:1002-1631(-)